MIRWISLLILALPGCQTQLEGPYVQASAVPNGKPVVIEIGADGERTPACLIVKTGETVEWRNMAPSIPVDVTSLGDPPELFSPSLVAPYPLARTTNENGVVTKFSFWRHNFTRRGVYEYYDTSSGDPGKKVVDPYYGTVTFAGISPTIKTGIVCVEDPGTTQCHGICCVKNSNENGVLEQQECPTGQCCDPKGKRCVLGSTSAPICSPNLGPVGGPAHRELACFADPDCPPTEAGTAQICQIAETFNHTCHVPE